MQQFRHFHILLLCLVSLPLIMAEVQKYPTFGWTPIKNVSDPHVIEIAEFAVKENNIHSGVSLELVTVLRGMTQVVSGTNYQLLLKAADGTSAKLYYAVVLEKAWEGYKELTFFKPFEG